MTMLMLRNDTKKKSSLRSDEKISIYMPTHKVSSPQAQKEDRTRYKNLINELKRDVNVSRKVWARMKKIYNDETFWKNTSQGLALFVDGDNMRIEHLNHEVPESITYAKHFYELPLMLSKDMFDEHIVVDFSLHHIRVFQLQYGQQPKLIDHSIKTFEELLAVDNEKQQQFHTPKGNRASDPQFHGQGGAKDKNEIDVHFYINYLAKEVDKLCDQSTLPLVLSGEQDRIENLRKELKHSDVESLTIYGNHSHISENELQEKLVSKIDAQKLDINKRELESIKKEQHEYVLDNLDSIWLKAGQGSIESLYLPFVRYTKDGVRENMSTQHIVDIPMQLSSFIHDLVTTVRSSGGFIKPTLQDGNSWRIYAIRRY